MPTRTCRLSVSEVGSVRRRHDEGDVAEGVNVFQSPLVVIEGALPNHLELTKNHTSHIDAEIASVSEFLGIA